MLYKSFTVSLTYVVLNHNARSENLAIQIEHRLFGQYTSNKNLLNTKLYYKKYLITKKSATYTEEGGRRGD